MKDIVIPTLEPDDIEVKIKQVTQKGAFALLYKTARTDMRYLDETYGANNWQIGYQMIGDMLFCTISVWDDEKKQWISKQSNGIESREDGEGNEAKGWASDSCKRSGFLWGIGRELYSSPKVFLNVATKQDGEFKGKPVYKLEDPWAKYVVTDIEYDNKRRISKLIIMCEKTGEIVYRYGVGGFTSKKTTQPKQEAPKATVPKQEAPKPEAKPVEQKTDAPSPQQKVDAVAPKAENGKVETTDKIPNPNRPQHEILCEGFLKKHNIDKKTFATWRADAVKAGRPITPKRWGDLSEDEWVTLLATMEALWEEGFFGKVA